MWSWSSPSGTCIWCAVPSPSRGLTGRGHRASVSLLAVLLVGGVVAGCQEGQPSLDGALDSAVQKLLAPRKTPQQDMLLAVSSEDADARRDAVARISASKKYKEEWAIKGLVAIACLESDPQTRCVALRALARSGDPRAVETALKILNFRDYPPAEVWPPDGLCRWDATEALATLVIADQVPPELRDAVRKTLLDRLRLDQERQARIAAARGLRSFPDIEVLRALIEGLRDEDFAVVEQCEDSLVRLTGRTNQHSPAAWEEWLAANAETLFAHAGEVPPSREPPYRNQWEKAAYETKDVVRWLWPGAKEE